MAMDKQLISLREGEADDAPFILNSWLKSYRVSNFARTITNTVYFEGHHTVIRNILKKATVLVACNQQNPSQIYGYLVYEKVDNVPVIHYCYVKHTFRGLGIGKKLLLSAKTLEEPGVFTHHTKSAERSAVKYALVHHPYLAFNVKDEK